MVRTPAGNTLFYGDNLAILREHVADEIVDLVYLDPPFNSNASYNVLFKAPDGHKSQAQIEAFDDTWHWNEAAEQAFDEVMQSGNSDAAEMLRAMRSFLKDNDMMAYLAMMAVRLLELHRVLKPTGSLYRHCDPTASHYLKIVLDAVFRPTNFINELIWKRATTKSDFVQGAKNWPRIHDTLLYYAKDLRLIRVFNQPFSKYDEEYVRSKYNKTNSDGRNYMLDNLTAPGAGSRGHPQYEFMGVTRYWRYNKAKMEGLRAEGRIIQPSPGAVPRYKRYLDEMKGIAVGDCWSDIFAINSQAQERLGYPTQKPLALLERIVTASSNESDVVLDPFCGCGTTVHAAQKLNRRWILAIHLIQRRLKDAFPAVRFDIAGVPKDLDGARALALADKYEFQKWALSMIEAQPYKGGKKGGDGGVDGYLYIKPDGKKTEKVIVSVKGGQSLTSAMVKDLIDGGSGRRQNGRLFNP